ncbi:MAG: DUF983 domain-containing protein [Flavobacteriales bacterium]|nr:DUF983 domain-containing protein [Flavobacteriales bacterium]
MPKSGLSAFMGGKCPQCRRGSIFTGSLFSKKFKDVHEHCPSCGVKFEQEPGFFWGAMYFSYALIVGMLIVLSVIMFTLYDDPSLTLLAIVIIAAVVLFLPFIVRLSRLLLIYIAAPYRRYKGK